jgi:hypothetical protein
VKVPTRNGFASWHLAGWLFADLLLVLFVVVLGSLPGGSNVAEPCPTTFAGGSLPRPPATGPCADPSILPSAPGAPTIRVSTGRQGLDPTSVTATVTLGSGMFSSDRALTSEEEARVLAEVDRVVKQVGNGRPVGFVLTFGQNVKDGNGVNNAVRVAERVNRLLQTQRPTLFSPAVVRSYWNGGSPGPVEIELFFLG